MEGNGGHPPDDFGYAFHVPESKRYLKTRLRLALVLTVTFMFMEAVGGLLTGSVALLADAGHMLTHAFALTVSLVGATLSERDPHPQRSFGYLRAEAIGGMINGATILLVSAMIFVEAIRKIVVGSEVHPEGMLVIATIGLIANLATAGIIRNASQQDLSARGAFAHLISDTISSVAVVAGGIIIIKTGHAWVDPALGFIVAAVVVVWGIRLVGEATHILLEGTPRSLDVAEVCGAFTELNGVEEVHDVHIWELGSGLYAMTAHIIVSDMSVGESLAIRDRINAISSERFNIGHTTLQFETPS